MRVIDVEQGSPEWHAARCGKATASRIADIVRRTKSGVSASRRTYAGELVAERLSGFQSEGFTSAAMQWGKDQEDAARAAYGFVYGVAVDSVGFVLHPTLDWSGCSPDGIVDDHGLVQIKCPNSAQHIATLLGEKIDPDYGLQMQWEMACTGRQWCDFVSYDPRLPGEMQLHVRRVARDPVMIAELEAQVSEFLAEVASTVNALIAQYRTPMAAE